MSSKVRHGYSRVLLNWQAPWRIKENHYSFPIKLLKNSADTRNLNLGKIVHAHLLVSNQASESHVIENNTLLNLYTKCAQVATAQQLFDGMNVRNIVSWSTLIKGYFHGGFSSKVLELLKTMIKVLQPNKYVLSIVLSCCAENGLLSEGRQCHTYALKTGLVFHLYVKNAILSLYSLCADMNGSITVFNRVPGSDICTYNIILGGLYEHGHHIEALDVLSEMVNNNEMEWDGVTYVTCFGLSACFKDLNLGLQLHVKWLKSVFTHDVFVNSAIIDMYGKCSRILSAKKLFDSSKIHNVVSWTAILTAYLQNECFEEVLKTFLDMKHDGVKPNEYTFSVLLNSSANLSAIGYGSSLHSDIMKTGFKSYITVGNALINMYSRSCDIEAASVVFGEMSFQDIITWNSMISGYSHHGLGKESLSVFHYMLESYIQPNYVTFVGILSACGHLGLVKEGFYYLHLMKTMGIEPGLEHYTCIIGLLGKAGKLDEAFKFMNSVPVKWDIVAWRTLLNACYVHNDYAVGNQVVETVTQMELIDTGTCILLSNMHAKVKKWDAVAETRMLMIKKNVKKEPGSSWIEIQNNTYVFVSDHNHNHNRNLNQHGEANEIRKKIRELLIEIKWLGYVPGIGSGLHDVEEEQIEGDLSYHSEKLAIAYGLMKTPKNAPIRVIKNLRMCDDCHSAVKLIAMVTNRVIIVRDANRFHRFRDGYCSCLDYW